MGSNSSYQKSDRPFLRLKYINLTNQLWGGHRFKTKKMTSVSILSLFIVATLTALCERKANVKDRDENKGIALTHVMA